MAKKEKTEAAEKIVKAEKSKAKKPKSDKPNLFVRMGKAIVRFLRDFRGELKKIVWPDFKTVLKSSGVVIAAIAIFLAFVWLIDVGLSKSIGLLSDVMRNANSEATSDTTTTTAATTTTALNEIVEDTTAAGEAESGEAASGAEVSATAAAGD